MNDRRFYDRDSELAQQALEGDVSAFGELVEKYQGPVYRFALNFFRDPTRAEDVAQDTFLRAYRFLHTYDPARRFATWLFTIARNQCIDRRREAVRRDEVSAELVPPVALVAGMSVASPLEVLVHREDWSRLLGAVRALPEKYRTPLVLCYLEGLAYQDIADIMGISLNNVKIRIFRAKKMILRDLGLLDGEAR